jgi:hypothetical protein
MAFPFYWAVASKASLMLASEVSFWHKPAPVLCLRATAVIKKSLGIQMLSMNYVTRTIARYEGANYKDVICNLWLTSNSR